MKAEPKLLTQMLGIAESITVMSGAVDLAKTYPPKIQPADEMGLTDDQLAELVKKRTEAVEAVRAALPKLDKLKADLESLTTLVTGKPAAKSVETPAPDVSDEPAPDDADEDEDSEPPVETPGVDLTKMRVDDLRDYADEIGCELPSKMKKDDIIIAIGQHIAKTSGKNS